MSNKELLWQAPNGHWSGVEITREYEVELTHPDGALSAQRVGPEHALAVALAESPLRWDPPGPRGVINYRDVVTVIGPWTPMPQDAIDPAGRAAEANHDGDDEAKVSRPVDDLEAAVAQARTAARTAMADLENPKPGGPSIEELREFERRFVAPAAPVCHCSTAWHDPDCPIHGEPEHCKRPHINVPPRTDEPLVDGLTQEERDLLAERPTGRAGSGHAAA